jgi:hypothetical protein
VVEYLPGKCEALSANLNTTKKKKVNNHTRKDVNETEADKISNSELKRMMIRKLWK